MARTKREVSKTGIYHILLRGINSLFLTNEDFDAFVALLKQKSKGIKVISYALLKNRIHIIIDAGDKSIGTVLKPIATSYARYCNRTRGTKGKLFYDRFKSEPISEEEQKDAVAFVNFIADLHNCGVYASLNSPLCKPEDFGLTDAAAKSTRFTRLFIDDYDCLSKSEMANYIYALCGVSKKDFKALPAEKQRELVSSAAASGKCSKALLYGVLSIKKQHTPDKKVQKPKDMQEKNLSVWLL